MRYLAAVALVVVQLFSTGSAGAQSYPTKPVRFILGPGGDLLTRLLGQKLTERWGQQVVVDQRPAAGGVIAADAAAKSAPDGYTALVTTGAFAANSVYYAKPPYDLVRDFAPVTQLVAVQFLLVVNPSLQVNSVEELLKLARARPGQLNFASAGPGTTAHLGFEMLKSMAQVNIVHVPYKSVADAVAAVIAGEVQMTFAVMQGGLPHVKSGRLKALGVSGAKRAVAVPDLPTVAEAGIPGFAFDSWDGVHVPAGTPQPIIAQLNAELVRALKLPDIQQRLSELGIETVGSTPAEFAAVVNGDIARWSKVIKDAGIPRP